jgi:PAS domain S-box-containing protein
LEPALTRVLLQQRGLPALAHLIGLSLSLFLVWDQLPPFVVLPWAGAVTLMVVVRAILRERARRKAWPSSLVTRVAAVVLGGLGLSWGIGVGVAAQTLSAETVAVLFLTLVGLAAAGVATLAATSLVFPLYILAMFVPALIGVGLTAQDRADTVFVALGAVFVAFMIVLHRQAHHALLAQLRTAEFLHTQERQLTEAQSIAHVGSWELDLATGHVTWSEEAYRLYGLPRGSPVSYEVFLARVHPDDLERVKQLIDQSLAEQRDIEYEYRVLRPDGTVRHVLGRNVVRKDETGTAVRFAGTSLDITERKIIESALKTAVLEVKTLRGYLRVCANCRRVLGSDGQWEQLESYVRRHTEAEFSHGMCPDCAARWATSTL